MWEERKHGVPALLSFLIPGLGQIAKGQVGKGIAFFFGTLAGYSACIMPGIALHLWNIYDAYTHNPERQPLPSGMVNIQVQAPHTKIQLDMGREEERSLSQPSRSVAVPFETPPATGLLKGWGTILLLLAGALGWWGGNILSFIGLNLWFWLLISVVATAAGAGLWAKAIYTDFKWGEKQKEQRRRQQEKEVLQLATQRGGRLTIAEVAAYTSLSLEEAKAMLERMAVEGHVGTVVSETGALVYQFFELERREQPQQELPPLQQPVVPSSEDRNLQIGGEG